MDSTSPIAERIAGQPSTASGSFFKPTIAMAFCTLVENRFVGRRWLLGPDSGLGLGRNLGSIRTFDADAIHRRYRERHSHLAAGHGHAS